MTPENKRLLAWIGIIVTAFVFFAVVYYGITHTVSVGIIGGADGPTSVLVANSVKKVNWIEVIFLLVAGAGIIHLLVKGNRKSGSDK